jgi:hypothetical protein
MATLLNTRLTDQTLVLPSGTTAERPANPAPGSMRFNTSVGIAEVYDYGSWRDLANGAESAGSGISGSGASTIMYIPFFGSSNSDITDQISGTVGTIGGTNTRNYDQGGYPGFYVTGGGYLDIRPPQFETGGQGTTLNGRKYWTVEYWLWNFGTGTGGTAQTMLEMNNYPHGILYRGAGTSVDHYWRNSPISLGNVTTGAWCHFALVGYGATIKVFQNGTQIADTMNAVGTSQWADPYYQGAAAGLRIGASNHTTPANQCTAGVFRKFRVSLGARYASAFTPADVYPIT